ncbi:hypothetical protein C8J57DRAFT_1675228 [Mycena rebaudengoi]|nr:hypothetical protein C8J57DRAFT_1675228 [Mycena rebaudengoi]
MMELNGIALPTELERAVFEAAAFLDYKNIPRLLLFSPLFLRLAPLVYHDLVCRRRRIDTSTSSDAMACSGATDIAFFVTASPSFLPDLDQIRPLKLSVCIGDLFGGRPYFSHSMFTNITHLDVSDGMIPSGADSESWNGITSLPRLTHLAFNCSDKVPDRFLDIILSGCQLLQALILIVHPGELQELQAPEDYADCPAFPMHDVRFMISWCPGYLRDWVTGA